MVGGEAWIGVDGGASGVRAARVVRQARGLAVAGPAAERSLAEDVGDSDPALVLASAVRAAAGDVRRIALGVAMPGLPTADGRGIEHALHGVVAPELLDRVEALLGGGGFDLVGGPRRLVGDGVAGAAGELHGARGGLRGVRSGGYVGVGTGVAEALVVDGEVVPLVELGAKRAWELGVEDAIAIPGILRRAGVDDPERAARRGDLLAVGAFVEALRALAELVARRIADHALERVVVAQRLALLLHDRPELIEVLHQRLRANDVDPARVVLSDLREAPILGAAVLGAPDGDG